MDITIIVNGKIVKNRKGLIHLLYMLHNYLLLTSEAQNDLPKPGEEEAYKNTSPQEGSFTETTASTDG